LNRSREGATDLFLPSAPSGRGPRPRAAVFYNPAMATDRDLGVAFASAWFRERSDASGWDMTAATGVRGLRVFHESGRFREFTFTEANPAALQVLEANCSGRAGLHVNPGDAREGIAGAPFDLVDLDPYGTPVPFVPTAIAATRPGGVLAVTATDMMVLAGAQPLACERRYGARPVRGRLGPEGGLRILLAYLSGEAHRHQRSLRPLLGYVRDHHVRAYVALDAATEAPVPVASVDPAIWTGPDLGERGPYGPLWLGPLWDAALVRNLAVPVGAARPTEVRAFLERLGEEVAVDVPFYYEANRLARDLGLSRPPSLDRIRETLRHEGYRVARTHARPEGFRTDAPRRVVAASVARLSNSG
jgi:tRNA (guanine26-N2/guanine27-N2)-dimethyltransferase